MKKIMALALAALMAMGTLTACGGADSEGAATTVKVIDAKIVTTVETIRTICVVAFLACLVIYIVRRIQFNKTEEYMGYKEYRKSLKK